MKIENNVVIVDKWRKYSMDNYREYDKFQVYSLVSYFVWSASPFSKFPTLFPTMKKIHSMYHSKLEWQGEYTEPELKIMYYIYKQYMYLEKEMHKWRSYLYPPIEFENDLIRWINVTLNKINQIRTKYFYYKPFEFTCK